MRSPVKGPTASPFAFCNLAYACFAVPANCGITANARMTSSADTARYRTSYLFPYQSTKIGDDGKAILTPGLMITKTEPGGIYRRTRLNINRPLRIALASFQKSVGCLSSRGADSARRTSSAFGVERSAMNSDKVSYLSDGFCAVALASVKSTHFGRSPRPPFASGT